MEKEKQRVMRTGRNKFNTSPKEVRYSVIMYCTVAYILYINTVYARVKDYVQSVVGSNPI